MQSQVLHFPQPDPAPQPQPIPHPVAPPPPPAGSPLPLPTVHVAPRWEYRHLERPLAELGALSPQELDALGAEGWELAGVTNDGVTVHFFFKRPTT